MDYSPGAAFIAGLVATAVMTAMLYMGRAMLPQQMPMNILYMLGSMMTRSTAMAYGAGVMMHIGMGVIFAHFHAYGYQVLGIDSGLLLWGLVFGGVHWVIASMGMGMVGSMHPLMRAGQMTAPGPFVRNFPMMTVGGFFMLHLVYGLVVGIVYEGLA